MLIAVDEATGVERDIIDALMGNLTSRDAQIVLIYNPIDTSSFPYEAEAKGDWKLIRSGCTVCSSDFCGCTRASICASRCCGLTICRHA